MNSKTKAVLCILSAALFFALMAAFAHLAGDLPAMQKAFFRNFIALFIAMVLLLRTKEKFHFQKRNLPGLLARSLFGSVGVFCNFYAVDHLLLSDASMLNKLSPFFAVIASYFLLKEKVSFRQGLTIVLAFFGALLIVKPSSASFGASLPAMVGFLGGVTAGIAYTFVRYLGQHGERAPFIVFFFSACSCLMTLPFLLFDYHPMTAQQLLCLLAAGACAAIAQFSITTAYSLAPAREISLFDYTQVIFSAIIGLFLFGQFPDHWSILGYGIIIGVSAYSFFQENPKILSKHPSSPQ